VQGDGICKDVWNKIEIVERLLMCVEIGATRGGAAGASILPSSPRRVPGSGTGEKGRGNSPQFISQQKNDNFLYFLFFYMSISPIFK
jgi:hypothetical protein